MKKILFFLLICITFISCQTTKTTSLSENEELVEYKNINYKVEKKDFITEKELKEDCEMLKYIIYTCYAGIDDAISNGFNLDDCINQIYNQSLAKKNIKTGLIPSADFKTITYTVFSKNLQNDDLHIIIHDYLHESKLIYYSDIYLSKKEDKYIVQKSEDVKIKKGQVYTGPSQNIYEFLTKDGPIFRYAVQTKLPVKTALISLDNQNYQIPVKPDEPIPNINYWTGLKTTDNTLYMSLGNCNLPNNSGVLSKNKSKIWEDYISNISKHAKNKSNIILDLRSNTGGLREYPAEMISAALYYKTTTDYLRYRLVFKMINDTSEDIYFLASPFNMQSQQYYFARNATNLYDNLSDESKEFYYSYWKNMKRKPVRKLVTKEKYNCYFNEFPNPDFKGNVYILLNQRSASASEFATAIVYLFQNKGINVTIVGENSAGAAKFGFLDEYLLPHSGLHCSFGLCFGESSAISSNPHWKGESQGFYPDYWATNETILDTLVELTKDLQLAETLTGLDKSQL